MKQPTQPIKFEEIQDIDARRGFKRASSPGVGVFIERGNRAEADFWRDQAGVLIIRFTARRCQENWRYCYECALQVGGAITDVYLGGELEDFIAELLFVWLTEGCDYGPAEYLD